MVSLPTYMPFSESADPAPFVRVYLFGTEKLWLHSGNSRVVSYAEPHAPMSHVEHWVGSRQGDIRWIFDADLIDELAARGFLTYRLIEPRDDRVRNAYFAYRTEMVDEIDVSDMVGDLDEQWGNIG